MNLPGFFLLERMVPRGLFFQLEPPAIFWIELVWQAFVEIQKTCYEFLELLGHLVLLEEFLEEVGVQYPVTIKESIFYRDKYFSKGHYSSFIS